MYKRIPVKRIKNNKTSNKLFVIKCSGISQLLQVLNIHRISFLLTLYIPWASPWSCVVTVVSYVLTCACDITITHLCIVHMYISMYIHMYVCSMYVC